MSSGGCESIGRGCAGEEGSAQSGRDWKPSNELWNVMYDCITGQVILSAAALAIEVLSWFLSPCVPRSMNHRGCAVTYTAANWLMWGREDEGLPETLCIRVMKGIRLGWVLWRSIDCVTTVMCYAIPFIPRYIHLWGYDWAGLHQVII